MVCIITYGERSPIETFLVENKIVPENTGAKTLGAYAQMVEKVLGQVPEDGPEKELYAFYAIGLLGHYKEMEKTGKVSAEDLEAALFRQAS